MRVNMTSASHIKISSMMASLTKTCMSAAAVKKSKGVRHQELSYNDNFAFVGVTPGFRSKFPFL